MIAFLGPYRRDAKTNKTLARYLPSHHDDNSQQQQSSMHGRAGRRLLATNHPVTWTFPSLLQPPESAYAPLNVAVGDTVTFSWPLDSTSPHGVVQIPTGNTLIHNPCHSCHFETEREQMHSVGPHKNLYSAHLISIMHLCSSSISMPVVNSLLRLLQQHKSFLFQSIQHAPDHELLPMRWQNTALELITNTQKIRDSLHPTLFRVP